MQHSKCLGERIERWKFYYYPIYILITLGLSKKWQHWVSRAVRRAVVNIDVSTTDSLVDRMSIRSSRFSVVQRPAHAWNGTGYRIWWFTLSILAEVSQPEWKPEITCLLVSSLLSSHWISGASTGYAYPLPQPQLIGMETEMACSYFVQIYWCDIRLVLIRFHMSFWIAHKVGLLILHCGRVGCGGVLSLW